MINKDKILRWGKKTYVMGIINLTPDSFSGDGIFLNQDPIKYTLDKIENMIDAGAHIVDIGAESSRPGHDIISAADETKRLLPILRVINKADLDCIISIDTYKPEVAKQCLDNGADWINNIWGSSMSWELANLMAEYKKPIILMHNRSNNNAVEKNDRLGSSYQESNYVNFLEEIKLEMHEMVNSAINAGILKENIILDPGIGFGKNVDQNLTLINQISEIKMLGFPVLIGPSRKSFIGQILDLPVDERMEGTAASVAVGIVRGADIIRVHDVKYMARIAKMCDALTR